MDGTHSKKEGCRGVLLKIRGSHEDLPASNLDWAATRIPPDTQPDMQPDMQPDTHQNTTTILKPAINLPWDLCASEPHGESRFSPCITLVLYVETLQVSNDILRRCQIMAL